MKSKKVAIFSDLHCGHLVGLTPRQFDYYSPDDSNQKTLKFFDLRRECWQWFEKEVKALGKVDVAIWNGDLIDGRGELTGGSELVSGANRLKQMEMAQYIIDFVGAKKNVVLAGSPYHVGKEEDYESLAKVDKFGSHEWVDINGLVFDCKHHIGGSQIPHGRATSIKRDALWNAIWAEHREQPKGDVIIRSHVHYYEAVDTDSYLAIITPALQGMGSKFGARRCSGRVNFGFISFEVQDKENYTWRKHLAKLVHQQASVVKF